MSDPSPVETLNLQVGTSDQLFNLIDPAPFRDRDLDPSVVDYVIEWAEDVPHASKLSIFIRIDKISPVDEALVRAGFCENFRLLAAAKRRELSRLFRDGRISLLIGLVVVGLAVVIVETISMFIAHTRYAQVVTDSAVIGAWVALWHPMNIFLFEWWPLRRRAVLYDRLSLADVRVESAS